MSAESHLWSMPLKGVSLRYMQEQANRMTIGLETQPQAVAAAPAAVKLWWATPNGVAHSRPAGSKQGRAAGDCPPPPALQRLKVTLTSRWPISPRPIAPRPPRSAPMATGPVLPSLPWRPNSVWIKNPAGYFWRPLCAGAGTAQSPGLQPGAQPRGVAPPADSAPAQAGVAECRFRHGGGCKPTVNARPLSAELKTTGLLLPGAASRVWLPPDLSLVRLLRAQLPTASLVQLRLRRRFAPAVTEPGRRRRAAGALCCGAVGFGAGTQRASGARPGGSCWRRHSLGISPVRCRSWRVCWRCWGNRHWPLSAPRPAPSMDYWPSWMSAWPAAG